MKHKLLQIVIRLPVELHIRISIASTENRSNTGTCGTLLSIKVAMAMPHPK